MMYYFGIISISKQKKVICLNIIFTVLEIICIAVINICFFIYLFIFVFCITYA